MAQLGEDRLSAGAREAVREITGQLSLAQIADWPDFIRSESGWDFAQPWHFLTVEDGQPFDEAVSRPAAGSQHADPLAAGNPDNVVEAIRYFAAILRGDSAAADNLRRLMERHGAEPYDGSLPLTALSFLVHTIGDVHQPLHVGRGGDLGGNKVAVNFFDEVSDLHSVWDTGLIERERLSYTEFVRFLESELDGRIDAGADLDPATWARESAAYRTRVYEIYGRTSRENLLPDLGYGYAHDQTSLVRQRLFEAGQRLAALLESIFGGRSR